MLTVELQAFVRSSLPAPPARILEVGAGEGALAEALRAVGYHVTAIDPAAEPNSQVQPVALIDAEGPFDAAVAVVSLHHVDPLEASCAHLASLLEPGAVLVIDELDSQKFDVTAAAWWLGQRRALGFMEEEITPDGMVEDLRHHIHPVDHVTRALAPHFALGAPVRGPYLHRWNLRPSLHGPEVDLIAAGLLPAVGWRQVAIRR
ncbi:MAG: class I SAM-dependent methyltransferase [Solirubrobacteraceae bacterium]